MSAIPVFLHSASEVIQRLDDLGYLPDKSHTELKVKAAIRAFQQLHGLLVDGDAGPKTQQAMFAPKYGRCGLPDLMNRSPASGLCKWPVNHVPLLARLSLNQLSRSQILSAFQAACEAWNAVCGINLHLAEAASEALIVADSGAGRKDSFDGAGGTLAWSYMPCGMDTNNLNPVLQKYDTAEPWTPDFLRIVACHEIGHAIGIDHLAAGNLMAPYYDPAVGSPRTGDIAEAVKRYGAPKPKDNPDDGNDVPTPDLPDGTVDLVGKRLVLVVEQVLPAGAIAAY